jgi:hypothetical protein
MLIHNHAFFIEFFFLAQHNDGKKHASFAARRFI